MKTAYFVARNPRELCQLLHLPSSEADRMEARRNLLLAIKKRMEKNHWTHEEAAKLCGVGRTVITAVVNGNLEKISTDRLMNLAHKLGLRIRLKVA